MLTERAARREQLFHPLDGIPARQRAQSIPLPLIAQWPIDTTIDPALDASAEELEMVSGEW